MLRVADVSQLPPDVFLMVFGMFPGQFSVFFR